MNVVTSLTGTDPALAGAVIATLIAVVARVAGALTWSGTGAAAVTGTIVFAAGWRWAALLVFFFVSSTVLSRIGAAEKTLLAGGRIAKSGARDAAQVFANGGAFAVLVAATMVLPAAAVTLAALGALACATSDTWATEMGVLLGGTPRSIRTMQRVSPGTSGGVTVVGVMAGMTGAAAIGVGAAWLGIEPAAPAAIAAAGVGGMIIDSVLGATVQSRRYCARCNSETESEIHHCGSVTQLVRGYAWLNNDGVNALATVSGAAIAAVFAMMLTQ